MKERQPTVVEAAGTLTSRHWVVAQGLIEGKTVGSIARGLEIGTVVADRLKRETAERLDPEGVTPGLCKAIVCGVALGKLDASGLEANGELTSDKEIQFLALMFRGVKEQDVIKVLEIDKSTVTSMRTKVPRKIGFDSIYSAVAWFAERKRIRGKLRPENLEEVFNLE